jgi:hypothetical protein
LSVCDELREVLGPDEVFSRMTVLLEDTAARYPDLRGGVRLGFGGTLDHAQLEERARKITGDRESVVRRALGEMVTYLEFELRNHPRIEDSETYLDASRTCALSSIYNAATRFCGWTQPPASRRRSSEERETVVANPTRNRIEIVCPRNPARGSLLR